MPASNGYATTTRIERVQPRFVAGRSRVPATTRPPEPDLPPIETAEGGDPVTWIGDRWASLRDAWSQTTFFLTDPDSWR